MERKKLTEQNKSDITRLFNEGYSYIQISNKLGLKAYTVKYFCIKNEMIEQKDVIQSWSLHDTESLKELFLKKLGVRKIAKAMNKSSNIVSRKLIDLNLISEHQRKTILNKSLKKEGKKCCWNCLETKQLDDFYGNVKWCKECTKQASANRHNQSYNSNFLMILKLRLSHSKIRAKQQKIEFALSEEILLDLYKSQNGLCFYSGRPLVCKIGDIDTLSIDRIDSTKGYVSNNIVLCGYKINNMKNDLPLDKFYEIIKQITINKNL